MERDIEKSAAVYQLSWNSFTVCQLGLGTVAMKVHERSAALRIGIPPADLYLTRTLDDSHRLRVMPLHSVACYGPDPLIFRRRSSCGFWRRSYRSFLFA
jgi:hypothetical protein